MWFNITHELKSNLMVSNPEEKLAGKEAWPDFTITDKLITSDDKLLSTRPDSGYPPFFHLCQGYSIALTREEMNPDHVRPEDRHAKQYFGKNLVLENIFECDAYAFYGLSKELAADSLKRLNGQDVHVPNQSKLHTSTTVRLFLDTEGGWALFDPLQFEQLGDEHSSEPTKQELIRGTWAFRYLTQHLELAQRDIVLDMINKGMCPDRPVTDKPNPEHEFVYDVLKPMPSPAPGGIGRFLEVLRSYTTEQVKPAERHFVQDGHTGTAHREGFPGGSKSDRADGSAGSGPGAGMPVQRQEFKRP